jgi:hypothetical protein
VIATIADRFNEMLKGLASGKPNLHFIDLRTEIKDGDWVNENHLNALAYRRVAALFEAKMNALLPKQDAAVQMLAKAATLAAFHALEQSLGLPSASVTPLGKKRTRPRAIEAPTV